MFRFHGAWNGIMEIAMFRFHGAWNGIMEIAMFRFHSAWNLHLEIESRYDLGMENRFQDV